MPTRRDVIKASMVAAAASAVEAFGLPLRAGAQPAPAPAATGPFTLPALPYAADALEPHIDAQTMTIHHDRHHAAYVTNLNTAVAGKADVSGKSIEQLLSGLDALPTDIRTAVRNNGGGHLNHTLFWTSMKKGGGGTPPAELGKAIDGAFTSFASFKDTMARTAMGVFGSGWAWLVLDAGKLAVIGLPNQDAPVMQGKVPLLGLDVWEHAYYLKYQNRRRDYVDAWFNVIDWDAVAARYQAASKG